MTDLSAFASLVQAASSTQTLTTGLLSITIRGHLSAAQTRDGCWIVQVPRGGTVDVIAAQTARGTLTGAMNWAGNRADDIAGLPQFPLQAHVGDALILLTDGASDRAPVRWASPQGISEATGIVFVHYTATEGLYCPPVVGRRDNWIVSFLRNADPIPETLIDWSRLPSKVDLAEVYGPGGIDPNAWGAAPPTIAEAIANHRWYAGDYPSDWRCAGRVPYTSHAGYGTFVSGNNSVAALLACSTLPLEQKKPLVHALCQRAIHDTGRFGDGARLDTDGGHAWGRRFNMVLFGMLTGIHVFADPRFLGNVMPEDQFTTSTSWWGEPNWLNYRHHHTNRADWWSVPPSTWGDRNDPSHRDFAWAVTYGGQTIPALVGAAAAVVMLGAEQFAPQMVQIVRQWMAGIPPAARAALESKGIDLAWGKDYAVPTGFAAECWRRYAAAP